MNTCSVVNEARKEHSDFLEFSMAADSFQSNSTSSTLTFLRLEFTRMRPGMNDFLMRIASPKHDSSKGTVITLRGNKDMAKPASAVGMAAVILREMQKRGDNSYAWGKTDADHLAKMILLPLKTFAANNQITLLRFSTDALL